MDTDPCTKIPESGPMWIQRRPRFNPGPSPELKHMLQRTFPVLPCVSSTGSPQSLPAIVTPKCTAPHPSSLAHRLRELQRIAILPSIMDWLPALSLSPVPPPRRGHSLTPANRLLYTFGGQSSSTFLNDMHTINPHTSETTAITFAPGPVPSPRAHHTLTPISSRILLLFGGETGPAHDPTKLNDLWTFDVGTRAWREVGAAAADASDASISANKPSPRAFHTAIFPDDPTIQPGLFVFGGSGGADGGTVFCLRIADWRWVPVKAQERFPCDREMHAAFWWHKEGMVVFGGDADGKLLDDVWLFRPGKRGEIASGRWRQVRISPARAREENRLPPCAGHKVVEVVEKPGVVMVWGGLRDRDRAGDGVAVIDLGGRTSEVLAETGQGVPRRRLFHTMVALGPERVFLYGGSALVAGDDGLENVEDQLHADCMVARTAVAPQPSGAASAFPGARPVRASVVRRGAPGVGGAANLPSSAYVAPVPEGTPFSGRILDQTEVGWFVQVWIKGREYRGVLVANSGNLLAPVPKATLAVMNGSLEAVEDGRTAGDAGQSSLKRPRAENGDVVESRLQGCALDSVAPASEGAAASDVVVGGAVSRPTTSTDEGTGTTSGSCVSPLRKRSKVSHEEILPGNRVSEAIGPLPAAPGAALAKTAAPQAAAASVHVDAARTSVGSMHVPLAQNETPATNNPVAPVVSHPTASVPASQHFIGITKPPVSSQAGSATDAQHFASSSVIRPSERGNMPVLGSSMAPAAAASLSTGAPIERPSQQSDPALAHPTQPSSVSEAVENSNVNRGGSNANLSAVAPPVAISAIPASGVVPPPPNSAARGSVKEEESVVGTKMTSPNLPPPREEGVQHEPECIVLSD